MKLFWIFFVAVAYISRSSSIRCYECAQAPQHRCANVVDLQTNICPEPNDPEKAEEAGIKNVCIKTSIANKSPNETEPYINRYCGRVGPGRVDSCSYAKAQSKNISCFSCDEELCNDSTLLAFSFWTFVFGVILVRFA